MICGTCGGEVDGPNEGDCPKCKGPTLVAGRYRLLEVLGRGANGITYRAERASDGQSFAVKEIPLRTLESAKAIELFEREARVLRELRHDAIPRYEDDFVFGEGKSTALYLVQELVSGQTLAEEATQKRYDLSEVLGVVAEVADILDYLHRRTPAVVHRDVKPKNVMRRDDGRLVLIDFGSVRDALGPSGGSTVAGTFGYMAPEQLAGKATPASDIHALGALALALLTRREPETLVGDDRRIDVRAYVEGTEAALALLEEMVDPVPSKRPQRASDVARRARTIAAAKPEPPVVRERPRKSKPAMTKAAAPPRTDRETAHSKQTARLVIAVSVAGTLGLTAVVGLLSWRQSNRVVEAAKNEPGIPELYARPIAVDVNADGTEDMIVVSAIDEGPQHRENETDDWGIENGRFKAFVQAIDGKDGHVLYSIPQGKAFTSLGAEGKTMSERIVLVARGARLGVARIPATGEASLTLHELRDGKEVKTLSFGASSGRACENMAASPSAPKGTFWFEGAGGNGGTTVDLEQATVAPAKQSSCAPFETSNVADVPEVAVTDRTKWAPRFSHEMTLRKGTGPWGGREVVQSGGLGVFLNDKNVPEKPATLPTITIDNGGPGRSTDRDNTKIDVVAFDLAAGTTRFERSLASLGFGADAVDHVEGTDVGPLLFFAGSRGLALLDPNRGDKVWSLPLPKGHHLSSYTLSKTHAYLHVFGPNTSIFGFLSKKLGSRILVVDLARGAYIRSVPAGSLEPEPEPKTASFDPSWFKPVAGCTCLVGRGSASDGVAWSAMTLEERRRAMGLHPGGDAGTASPDGGAAARLQLGMYIRSSVDSGGRKRFDVAYAFDVAGDPLVLPHYVERRTTLAPPQTIEGDVSLALACRDDTVVVVADRAATAWSLSKKDELWSIDLPVPRTEPKTTLGGGASVSCVSGTIDDRGRVHVPTSSAAGPKELVLGLADGSLEPPAATKSGHR
jgi:serine/threonine protein kinase